MPGNDPRKHHYQPEKAVLRHFANATGKLHFWRREFSDGKARLSSPRQLFRRSDLNALFDEEGRRDVSVELFLGDVDGRSAVLVDKVVKALHQGKPPQLDIDDWEAWVEFVYYLHVRSPFVAAGLMAELGIDGSFENLLDKMEEDSGPMTLEERSVLSRDPRAQHLWHNSVVSHRAGPPTPAVRATFEKLGIVVFRAPIGSLIVGDCPMVNVQLGPAGHGTLVVPFAHDGAFGVSLQPMTVRVTDLTADQADAVNRQTCRYSEMIAGRTAKRVEHYTDVEYQEWSPSAVRELSAGAKAGDLDR